MDRRRKHERRKSEESKLGAIPPLKNPARNEACRLNPALARILLIDAIVQSGAVVNTWVGDHPETLARVLLLEDGAMIDLVAQFPALLMDPERLERVIAREPGALDA